MTSFPNDFLWGGASSASQYEGAYNEGGKGLNTNDFALAGSNTKPRMVTYRNKDTNELEETYFMYPLWPNGSVPELQEDKYYPSHKATDFYHHYKEDIKLLAELGLKVYRFSVSWSRVFPTGEEPLNEEGLQFYEDVVDELLKYNIEPMITLSHYETPIALSLKYNGWEDRKLIDLYCDYTKVIIERFKGKVKYYLTFNEINTLNYGGYLVGGMLYSTPQGLAQAQHNTFVARAKTVKLAHEIGRAHV